MTIEKVLYGIKNGDEEWREDLLTTNESAFEEVKKLATKDGYGRFRIATIDLTEKPDFTKTLNK